MEGLAVSLAWWLDHPVSLLGVWLLAVAADRLLRAVLCGLLGDRR